MLPTLSGRPIRVNLKPSLGPHLAATNIPNRIILLDSEVLARPGDFERILIHEIFHFAWPRLSNQTRRSWELHLEAELAAHAKGELGWSAEWRKRKLKSLDLTTRTKAWRLYACESFCDTAAWLYSGLSRHSEFTLPVLNRRQRRRWFQSFLPPTRPIPI